MTTTTSNDSIPAFKRTASRATVAAAVAAALALGACSTDNPGPKQTGGTILGAVAGGLAGSAFGRGTGQGIMIGLGTLLGAYVGSEAGQSLDRADKIAAAHTAQEALEYQPAGKSSKWVNPDNNHSGTITPTKTYQEANGTYCREYQQTVTVGGKTQQAYGTACRQPDGTWKIVSQNQ